MDICHGSSVRNATSADLDAPLLDTPMSDVCAMDEGAFATFRKTYDDEIGNRTEDEVLPLMQIVTEFCFSMCNYTCPAYIYSVFNDSTLVIERLSVFMPPAHYSYSFIVPFVLLIGIVLLVGVLGNLLTAFVIIRSKVLQASSHYLISLAASDIFLLVLTGPTEIAVDMHYWPWKYTRILCRSRYFLIEACAFNTVLHIVTFTIERYFVICHPMRAKSLVSGSRRKKIIGLIWIVSLLIALPIFFAYDLRVACDGIPESTICEIKDSAWESRVQSFYIFSSIILFFIPMIIITVLYSLIARVMVGQHFKVQMRRNGNVVSRKSSGANNLKEEENVIDRTRKQVVNILALIAVCFFACWFPFHVIRLMPHFGAENWSEWFTEVLYHKWLYHASILLLYTSSAINPFLYNLMSKRFRRAVRTTLCCEFADHVQRHMASQQNMGVPSSRTRRDISNYKSGSVLNNTVGVSRVL